MERGLSVENFRSWAGWRGCFSEDFLEWVCAQSGNSWVCSTWNIFHSGPRFQSVPRGTRRNSGVILAGAATRSPGRYAITGRWQTGRKISFRCELPKGHCTIARFAVQFLTIQAGPRPESCIGKAGQFGDTTADEGLGHSLLRQRQDRTSERRKLWKHRMRLSVGPRSPRKRRL